MTGAAARVGASCDYDTCALRFKPTVWQWEIVKGSDGKSVGSLGGLRTPNIAALMADVPEAAQQARAGQRRYLRSSVMIWGGTIASVAGLAFYYGSEMHTTGNIVGYTGLAALFIGGYERAVSLELLSKSMWLYNRALRR